jgi:hypothetical protein
MAAATKRRAAANKPAAKRRKLPESAAYVRRTNIAVRDIFSAAETLTTFWDTPTGALTLDERKLIVDQALVVIGENYVHLPLKRTIHATDPVQALKNLRYRLDGMRAATMGPELTFHAELIRIFASVRDLHTIYQLPSPYDKKSAVLPFDVEEYFVGNVAHYQVSHLTQGFTHPTFVAGVEITAWSGVPIERAIEINGDRRNGSNPSARKARGMQYLTIRPLLKSLPPDEAWVDVDYIALDGSKKTLRFDWMVLTDTTPPGGGGTSSGLEAELGVDAELEAATRIKRILFAPQTLDANRARARRAAAAGEIETTFAKNLKVRTVETAQGPVGHIRILSFTLETGVVWQDFNTEVRRLLALLPKEMLIIDVRGNPGGTVMASEGLLQFFTPRRIVPAPNQFIVSPLNRRLVFNNRDNPRVNLGPWLPSMDEARFTSAVYSAAHSLTSEAEANGIGQIFRGRVVCITDARSYSATDVFASGFQDHEIGLVIGTDDTTGAGGANVWEHKLLRSLMTGLPAGEPPSPYAELPRGTGMKVAIRRTLRVGKFDGAVLEDFGVKPDKRWKLTRNDLLNSNADLMEFAAGAMAAQPLFTLEVEAGAAAGGTIPLSVTTGRISRLDIYVDGRPAASQNVNAGIIVVKVPASANVVRLEGFNANKLVVSNRLRRAGG